MVIERRKIVTTKNILSEYNNKCCVRRYFYIIIVHNFIEEEVKERIVLGSKVYYAKQKTFKNKLVSKKAKLKLYWSIIRPVITHASKTWVLKNL